MKVVIDTVAVAAVTFTLASWPAVPCVLEQRAVGDVVTVALCPSDDTVVSAPAVLQVVGEEPLPMPAAVRDIVAEQPERGPALQRIAGAVRRAFPGARLGFSVFQDPESETSARAELVVYAPGSVEEVSRALTAMDDEIWEMFVGSPDPGDWLTVRTELV
jgi:hypothetical protein